MKRNSLGFTLIEIIVSIAILGILAMAFLPMFTSGFKFIINNGNQIKGMFADQNSIEQKVAQGTTIDTDTMTIDFPGKTIQVKGENITEGPFNLFITKK